MAEKKRTPLAGIPAFPESAFSQAGRAVDHQRPRSLDNAASQPQV